MNNLLEALKELNKLDEGYHNRVLDTIIDDKDNYSDIHVDLPRLDITNVDAQKNSIRMGMGMDDENRENTLSTLTGREKLQHINNTVSAVYAMDPIKDLSRLTAGIKKYFEEHNVPVEVYYAFYRTEINIANFLYTININPLKSNKLDVYLKGSQGEKASWTNVIRSIKNYSIILNEIINFIRKREFIKFQENKEYKQKVDTFDTSEFNITQRDIDKMNYYRERNSDPERLAKSIKDEGKLISRLMIAANMGWQEAVDAFSWRLSFSPFNKPEEMIDAYIQKGKNLNINENLNEGSFFDLANELLRGKRKIKELEIKAQGVPTEDARNEILGLLDREKRYVDNLKNKLAELGYDDNMPPEEYLEEEVEYNIRDYLSKLELFLYDKLRKNAIYPDDLYFEKNDDNTLNLTILIDGDWKHDHLFTEKLVDEFCIEHKLDVISTHEQAEESDDDCYKAYHFFVLEYNDLSESPEEPYNYVPNLNEDNVFETYSQEELDDMVNKIYNQQKILNIYRRHKYGDSKLYAHTRCINCGREKRVFLSNLVKDPNKYGSCVCSDTNVESRLDNIEDLYDGSKRLSTNTSGYTGVTFVKNSNGEPYDKWRAYIEVDGKRTYLGDFKTKSAAIRARKEAAEKGLKWYKNHKNQFMKDYRKKSKRYRKLRSKKNTKK